MTLDYVRKPDIADVYLGCPLYPQKQTFSEAAFMSAKCQKRTHGYARFC